MGDIIYRSGSRPASGDIIYGITYDNIDSALLDMIIPFVERSETVLALVLRDDPVSISDTSWEHVQTRGFGDMFLDVWKHRGIGLTYGSTLSFMSVAQQELQGGIYGFSNLDYDAVIEASADAAFTNTLDAAAPQADSTQKVNTYLCAWLADSVVTWTPPSGFSAIESYSSAEIDSRSLLIAHCASGSVVDGEPGEATSSAPATGRAFTLVLHYEPPSTPAESDLEEEDVVASAQDTGATFLAIAPATPYLSYEDGAEVTEQDLLVDMEETI